MFYGARILYPPQCERTLAQPQMLALETLLATVETELAQAAPSLLDH